MCVCADGRPILKTQRRRNYVDTYLFEMRCCRRTAFVPVVVVAVIRLFVSIRLFALHSYSYPRKRRITIRASFFHLFFTSKINKPTHIFRSMQSICIEEIMGRQRRQPDETLTESNAPFLETERVGFTSLAHIWWKCWLHRRWRRWSDEQRW